MGQQADHHYLMQDDCINVGQTNLMTLNDQEFSRRLAICQYCLLIIRQHQRKRKQTALIERLTKLSWLPVYIVGLLLTNAYLSPSRSCIPSLSIKHTLVSLFIPAIGLWVTNEYWSDRNNRFLTTWAETLRALQRKVLSDIEANADVDLCDETIHREKRRVLRIINQAILANADQLTTKRGRLGYWLVNKWISCFG